MNVVGKVGSLISQGVYSVATPFHPFGGAVDVIVVQQQDGTFRSTPWYVRFGKFQGVLKGAEKVVRITVNGTETDFNMFLDNSGEAYFVRQVDSSKGFEKNGDGKVLRDEGNKNIRLEHSVSDSGVAQLSDEYDATSSKRLERLDTRFYEFEQSVSDAQLSDEFDATSSKRLERLNTRFYEFEDEQSLIESSVNFSESESGRYGGLDGESSAEARGLDSEVVLVSVDGHILTAPVSVSEQSAEDLQLSTPKFHLGPGEGPDFCEGNAEFSSGDNVWAADYISRLHSESAKDSSDNFCKLNIDSTALRHRPEDFEEGGEHAFQTKETQNLPNHESEFNRQSDVEDEPMHIKKDDIFKNDLELSELSGHGENIDSEEIDSPSKAQISLDKPCCSPPDIDKTDDGNVGDSRNKDVLSSSYGSNSSNNNGSPDLPVEGEPVEKKVLDRDYMGSKNVSVDYEPEWKDEQFGRSAATEGIIGSQQRPSAEGKSTESEIAETETTSGKEIETLASLGFEISLCGNEFQLGMGSDAAAKVFEAHRISEEQYQNNAMSIVKNANLIIRFGGRYYPWEKAVPLSHGMAEFGLELAVEPKDAIHVEQDESSNPKDDDPIVTSTSSGPRWRLWPIPFRRAKTIEHASSNSSSEEALVETVSVLQETLADSIPSSSGRIESPGKQFIRTNVPTNEQIASLNLKDGQNMVTFSFCTRVLGTQQVDAHIYLWKWNAKIVISDVDGTITKSDVLGQFMPLVGRDWTQSGVAKLFSAIKENGYQLMFLSARAIAQACLTRSFLLNLKQDGLLLPNGPVVISPDGLFPSLFREVIRRAPHEFKIACLEDIKKLFPSDHNPFYAGFGNRDTDELSYRKIGIPKGKIFIINPKGEVAISHCSDVRSYTSLHTLVNDMFPPTSLVEQEDYNSWNFWKVPLPDID
ncbi:hypothetical protein PTKIN_Ptkin13bG0275800 [Pterospermum kingtungense]